MPTIQRYIDSRWLRSGVEPKGLTVMTVEDEPDIRCLIVHSLLAVGFDVVEAYNGADAVGALDETHIDLVLMDVRMPRMTGYEACRIIKQEHPNTLVVFLSAKGQESEIETGLDLGAEGYILKPFAPDCLQLQLEEILTRMGKLV